MHLPPFSIFCFFFFNDTATTEIYTLSLHDALPISPRPPGAPVPGPPVCAPGSGRDRKSTRLNSSHLVISYAVFCLKKKNKLSEMVFVGAGNVCRWASYLFAHHARVTVTMFRVKKAVARLVFY